MSGIVKAISSGIKAQWYYERHCPEKTLLYQTIEEHYPNFLVQLTYQGRSLPRYVQREFEDYLKCGRFEHGFPGNCSCIALISYIPVAMRVKCEDCHSERVVAFSCKRRGFCPSCGARRIVESVALLVDEVAVLPKSPLLRFLRPRNECILARHRLYRRPNSHQPDS